MFYKILAVFRVILPFYMILSFVFILPIIGVVTESIVATIIYFVFLIYIPCRFVFKTWTNAVKESQKNKLKKHLGNNFTENRLFYSSNYCSCLHFDSKNEVLTLFNEPNVYYSVPYENTCEVEISRQSGRILIHVTKSDIPVFKFLVQKKDYFVFRRVLYDEVHTSVEEWSSANLN